MTDLPQFSGYGVQCPKCLFDDVDFAYQPAGTRLMGITGDGAVIATAHDAPEWMLRRCRVCEYGWAETTANPA